MSVGQDPELVDDEYDEEADSDFKGEGANEEDLSESSSDEDAQTGLTDRPAKRQKTAQDSAQTDVSLDLDSGDEATIKEQKKARRRQKKRGEIIEDDSDKDSTGWKAKTRAMREREKEEIKRSKLANIEGSTIDVDKVWEEMNRSGPLPPVHVEGIDAVQTDLPKKLEESKESIPALIGEEMITIKRKFKFAGEVHVEEKIVPKTSAEARLWLAQQEAIPQPIEAGGTVMQRPLRKISKFDPNYNNLEAFKINWSRLEGSTNTFKGPKLNVVEKSKMDWASHVDAAGLQDELDVHAKAKEGYHGRMDFLNQVEQRKDEEARLARMKA